MSYTKGPWTVEDRGVRVGSAWYSDDMWPERVTPEDLALLSSAPDLYEALKALLPVVEYANSQDPYYFEAYFDRTLTYAAGAPWQNLLAAARAALAKVEEAEG